MILRLVLLIGLLTTYPQAQAVKYEDGLKVLTGTQVTYSIAYALLQGTPVDVVNVPADGRRFSSLKDYIERRKKRFEPLFNEADAVIAFTNVLPSDPLYRYAREVNIALVNIDAAQPWSFDSAGVAQVDLPLSSVPWADAAEGEESSSSYFWLSLTNAARMTEIVGADLARVFPQYAETIHANRAALRETFLAMFREYQDALFQAADVTVFALANEFVYLTNDMGLFVDGYFIKQDLDWSEQDLAALRERLKSHGVKVVIHKWLPSNAIQKAIQQAGAQLVVLDTADPGLTLGDKLDPQGYQKILRANLHAITQALPSP